MATSHQGSVAGQVEALKRRFADAPGLPFAEVLSAELLTEVLREHGVDFRDRIYSPLVTLAMFMSQCADADPSLAQAVARLIAQRLTEGKPACSSDTGAYAKARQRLPERVVAELTRQTGNRLATQASQQWRWRGVSCADHREDLVPGSGLVSEDAGDHELKGVPDRWRLYRVAG